MKKLILTALLIITMMTLFGCAGDTASSDAQSSSTALQIGNPFTDYNTLEEAISSVGFDMTLPTLPVGYEVATYRGITGDPKMIEVIAQGGETDLTIRKGVSEGVSGIYTDFAETNTVESDGRTVTLKGENDKVYLAEWSDGDYYFSIDAISFGSDGTASGGLLEEEMLELVKGTT